MKLYRFFTMQFIFLMALLNLSFSVHAACVQTDDLSGTQTFTLYAGQNIDAGTVSVTVNGDNLDVTYSTTGGWELVETHVWVGRSLADMPQTRKGNPIPGNFPYHSGDITGQTSYTESIPLSTLQFVCPEDDQVFKLAAHAALRKDNGSGGYETQTGWSDGSPIVDKGNWATYSEFTLTCACDQTGGGNGDSCETAFAWNAADSDSTDDQAPSVCFLTIDEDGNGTTDFNRWGWSNGTLAVGSHTFQLWAAAGQCDLNKGTLVGSVTVNYDGSTATVSYFTNAPYSLAETHAYVGSEILPRNGQNEFTVAPGQYPQIHDPLAEGTTSDSFTFTGLSGSVYGVFHATTCGFEE
ncbi:hypothetical protein [Spartinivicinus ruber]|uniref:hypothetical protein n=1 Tax=Spartinivicinus ruber TaxID=2683272 RepID=UPI0013D3A708|nr:hypothetical protein [Spartinivicinus ruber]